MSRLVFAHGMGLSDPHQESELPYEWNLPAFQKLQHLELYASSEVSLAAAEAYATCWHWGNTTVFSEDDAQFYELQEENDKDVGKLLTAIRADLAVRRDTDGDFDRGPRTETDR
jgi:hypothetical protein